MAPRKAILVAAALTALGVSPVALGQAINATWNGTTGNWTDSSRWSTSPAYPNNTPTTTYNATVSAGQVTVNQPIAIWDLKLQAGAIQIGTSALDVGGTMNWTGGTLFGQGGTTNVAGMSISGTEHKRIEGAIINNAGYAVWTGTGDIYSQWNGGTFNNLATGTFELRNDSNNFTGQMYGITFNNAGLLHKTTGDASIITTPLHNSGTVRVDPGRMLFLESVGSHTGRFEVGSGGTLFFGSYSYSPDVTLQATSVVQSTGGTVNIRVDQADVYGTFDNTGQTTFGGGLTYFHPGAVVQNLGSSVAINSYVEFNTGAASGVALSNPSIGTIGWLGGSDNVTVSGAMTWSGGSVGGSGVKTLTGTTTMSGGYLRDGATLTNTGTFNWTANEFTAYPNSTFNNQSGATFQAQGQNVSYWTQDSAQPNAVVFNNHGTYRRTTGSGSIGQHGIFNNHGTVEVKSGSLAFTRLRNHGQINVDQGTMIVLASQGELYAGSTLSGAGSAYISSGTINVSGTYNIGTQTTVRDNATLNFYSGATVSNVGSLLHLWHSSATATFNTGGPVTLKDVWNEGQISGADTLHVTGRLFGNGRITSNVVMDGQLDPGNSPGLMRFAGALQLGSEGRTLIEIKNAARSGVDFDVIQSTGNVTLGGDLSVKFLEAFYGRVTQNDVFTILTTTGTLAGAFDNVASGERLDIIDGYGSFLVSYGLDSPFGANSIVLSNYAPEPTGVLPIAGLAIGLLLRRRRGAERG